MNNKNLIIFISSVILWGILYYVFWANTIVNKTENTAITPLTVHTGTALPESNIDIFEWRFSWFTWSVWTLSTIKWDSSNWNYSYEIGNKKFEFSLNNSDIFNKVINSWTWNILDKLSFIPNDEKFFKNKQMSADNIKNFNSMINILESSTSTFNRLNYWIDNNELKNKTFPWILFLSQNLIYLPDSDYFNNYKSLFTICTKLSKWSDYAIYIGNQCLANLYLSANSKLVTEKPDANEIYKLAMILLSDDYSFVDQIRNALISNWGYPIENIKNWMADSYIYAWGSIKLNKIDLTQLKISLGKFEKTIWNSEMAGTNKKFIENAKFEIFWNNEDMRNILIRKMIQYYSNQQK